MWLLLEFANKAKGNPVTYSKLTCPESRVLGDRNVLVGITSNSSLHTHPANTTIDFDYTCYPAATKKATTRYNYCNSNNSSGISNENNNKMLEPLLRLIACHCCPGLTWQPFKITTSPLGSKVASGITRG
jgi:hypothetical protein